MGQAAPANSALGEHRARGRAVGSVGDAPDGVGWLGNLAASAVRRIRLTGDKVVFWTSCIEDWPVGAIPGIVDLRKNRPTSAILMKKFCRLRVRQPEL
jgi:hypothetical protein